MKMLAITVCPYQMYADSCTTQPCFSIIYSVGSPLLSIIKNEISKYLACILYVTSFHLSAGSQADNHHGFPKCIQL